MVDSSSGNYIRTPEGSEVDVLESMYLVAEWLVFAHTNKLITNQIYLELLCYLDSIPTVGE